MTGFRSSRHSRRGFALLEILFCVMATAMMVIVGGRLMYQVGRVYREAPESMNEIQSSQQWLQMIRVDVWSANDITKGADGSLAIKRESRSVSWRAESNRISRIDGDSTARWPTTEAITFESVDGLWLIRSAKTTIALPQANRGNP